MTTDKFLKCLPHLDFIVESTSEEIGNLKKQRYLIDEKIRNLRSERDEAALQRGIIEEAIQAVDNDTYRKMLTFYFLQDMTWEEVAERLNYTSQHIYKMRAAALAAVYRALPQEIRATIEDPSAPETNKKGQQDECI